MYPRLGAAFSVAVAAALCACHEPSSVVSSARPSLEGEFSPMCMQGCVETDPSPTAPGYFLSSAVTPSTCIEGIYTDADRDRLGDRCETDLAQAFAPELFFWNLDVVGREPHWVARPIDEDGEEMVYIGYLISYYRDAGNSSFGCQTFPFVEPSCGGHNGDSEAIWLKVRYDSETEHWVLHQAYYSAHEHENVYSRYVFEYPSLYYPSKPGGYPRSYVSMGKHANYHSASACEAGGFGNADTCAEVNTGARVYVAAARNLGSRNWHSVGQDCKVSQDPSYLYYGAGRQECYWTGLVFRGWIPDSVGGLPSTSYRTLLIDHGF